MMRRLVICDHPAFTRIGKILGESSCCVEPACEKRPFRMTVSSGNPICPNWWFWATFSWQAWRSCVERSWVPLPGGSPVTWESEHRTDTIDLRCCKNGISRLSWFAVNHFHIPGSASELGQPSLRSSNQRCRYRDPARRRLSSF